MDSETSDNSEDGKKEKSAVVVSNCPEDSVATLDEPEPKDEEKTPTQKRGKIRKKTSARKKRGSILKKKGSSTKTKTPHKKKNVPETKVASLVFLNMETTGLAQEIGKSNVQMTELAMVAIGREEFEKSEEDFRIVQKLRLCIKPRSRVSSGASEVSGLYRHHLENCPLFDQNVAETINLFLSHLSKPVCLLAHNGNSYGFRLLKAEFSRLSMSLPSDLLVADTQRVFRSVGVGKSHPPEKVRNPSVKYTKMGISCTVPNLYLYFFNEIPTERRSAESNCIALSRLCHQIKDSMIPWVDKNCKAFNSVSPMW